MKIILSPAKKMQVDQESGCTLTRPWYYKEAEQVLRWLQSLTPAQQQQLWQCNDALARENHDRLAGAALKQAVTPALLAYVGIQYQYMAPTVFEDGQLDYAQEQVRILSGLYGVLRPLDGVIPYRLEMQARGAPEGYGNLYQFWGDKLYQAVRDKSRIILNLASKEYSKAVEKYLQPGDRFVTVVFAERSGSKLVQKGVYAKMARGEMVRYLAGIQAREPEDAKGFRWSGYQYSEEQSKPDRIVFVR
ncbi:MAG: peroxide stress protein YaaA [Acidaminococcus sp.]|jgi:hypothetical protein|nr:peroxide stress protein YaaA [Acidaminococcus sp.]